jgi:Ca2+-binding RTX toxin-like protein
MMAIYEKMIAEFVVNIPNTLEDGDPSSARLTNGNTVIAFASGFGSEGVLEATFRILNDAGATVGEQIGLGQQTAFTAGDPEVAALNDGTFVIAWISGQRILAQHFSDDGVSLGPVITLQSGAHLKDLDIVARSDGGFVVSALHGVAQGGGFAAVTYDFASNDATTSIRTIVQSAQYGGSGLSISSVETADGGLFTLWAGLDGIGGRFEDDDIIYIDSDFNLGQEREAQATALTNGQVVVAWAEKNDIRIALLEPENAGTLQPGAIANANRVDVASQPNILALSNGDFVVTWRVQSPGNSSADLHGQVFETDGTPLGGGFNVNLTESGNQSRPAVSELADGGIRVVWQSNVDGDLEVIARDFTQVEITAGTYQIVEDAPTEADLISGGPEADSLAGLGGDDTIYGEAGADTIDGGSGGDVMIGGDGADTYYVDDSGDSVMESRNWIGEDLVYASVDFRMGSSHIEKLYLVDDAILGAGNGLANEIRGNAQNNILDGGKNNDTLMGGAGNDTYLVRSPGDVVVEAAGRGFADTVKAFRAYELTANVEWLYLQTLRNADGKGVAGINGIGNELDNTIVGNPFDNTIIGRIGNDVLKGQAGADTFVFDRAIGEGNVDRIIDFNVNEADEGDLLKMKGSIFGGLAVGVLDADYFVAGTAATDADDRFIFDSASGRLWLDADGAGGAAQELIATFEQDAMVMATDIEIF